MNITTLEQAAKHLIESGKVDMSTMTVEGKQLIEACGFSVISNINKTIERQINKHQLIEGKDYTLGIDAQSKMKAKQYQFTMNAANHILLAAMTDKGKKARQQAINLKDSVELNVERGRSLMIL